MIRVAIGDDHPLVREGLRRILGEQADMEVVGEASDGAEAVELVKRLQPDVILLDVSMPNTDGIEATRIINELGLPTRVLILTVHTDEHYALRALRAGALGFVLKNARADELVAAVNTVHRGERCLAPELQRAFADKYLSPDGSASEVEMLSKREFEVMCMLALGQTNREIADKLFISVKTVDTHRHHVLKKLNLRNNSDITRFAIQNGFINV